MTKSEIQELTKINGNITKWIEFTYAENNYKLITNAYRE